MMSCDVSCLQPSKDALNVSTMFMLTLHSCKTIIKKNFKNRCFQLRSIHWTVTSSHQNLTYLLFIFLCIKYHTKIFCYHINQLLIIMIMLFKGIRRVFRLHQNMFKTEVYDVPNSSTLKLKRLSLKN